jgi:hypothetical protein
MNIVTFIPAERLDDLVAASGFNLGDSGYEYKYTWLLERIGMLRRDSEVAALLHDNPDKRDLVAAIQRERDWSKGLQSTIDSLMIECEALRKERADLKAA